MANNALHPSILQHLCPEYVEFHNKQLRNLKPLDYSSWDPSIRCHKSPITLADLPAVPVKSTRDIPIEDSRFFLRVYFPAGTRPDKGWPVLVWFHGGGLVLGDEDSDKGVLTCICNAVPCIVVTVVYRLAPEHPFPAAVDDAVDAVEWVGTHGERELGVDPKKIAVGGVSAGANLATVASLLTPVFLVAQLLNVPVVDNSSNSWLENQHAPGLDREKMHWYQRLYLPNPEDRQQWMASPILAPKSVFKGRTIAKEYIKVAQIDILRRSGIEYGKLLEENGVIVRMKEYTEVPHAVLSMVRELPKGGEMLEDIICDLSEAFT